MLLFITISLIYLQLVLGSIGDICEIHNDINGICKNVKNCQYSLDALEKGHNPRLCSLNDKTVICCSSDKSVDEKVDLCLLPNQDIGYCVKVHKCPHVRPLIKQRQHPPVCDYEGLDPIFCCKHPTILKNETKLISRKSSKLKEPISQTKCKEYNDNFLSTTPSPKNEFTNSTSNDSKYYIVGGESTVLAEFPHMAALGYKNEGNIEWACGGTLISEFFVLTAAHCLKTQFGPVQFVRLGVLNLKEMHLDEVQNFTVANLFKHPEYRSRLRYHDIGLIKLNKSVNFNEIVRPACLQIQKEFSNDFIQATGWGKTSFMGESAVHLQSVELQLFSQEECNTFYRNNRKMLPNGIDDETQICAGDDNRDTCHGDSGGPLQIYHTINYYKQVVVGVTSFGKACGIDKSIGVYTRVSYYVPWIESIVWPN